MNLYSEIKNYILQDVENENETKKTSLCLRINAMIMLCYFVALTVIFGIEGEKTMTLISALCIAAYAISFWLTYINHTKAALWFAEGLAFVWIVTFVYQLGWNCGVQHFLFVLLLLVFTPEFWSVGTKIVHSTLFCVVRLGLYMYTRNYEAIEHISSDMSVVFQVMNTFFVFFALVSVLLLFTYDSARMEEKLVRYNRKLHKLASEDPLTGLMNRRSMMNYLTEYVKTNSEEIGPCAAIGDLDFFKKINDTYGHEAGDEVLKRVSALFAEFMEKYGQVGRWGGEEFLFVFTNCNLDEANSKLIDLIGEVRKISIPYNNEEIHVTMTIGVEEFDGTDIEKMINTADEKLYIGKASGRDRVIC